MLALGSLLCVVLLAPILPESPASSPPDTEEVAAEPAGGAGVSPVELIPRIELRQSFARLPGGVSLHATTAAIDIQFLSRVLLHYEVPRRVLSTGDTSTTGLGDIRLQALTVIASDARRVAVVIVGAMLDTASRPPLGAGKQQVFFGAGAAIKPVRWWLPYAIVQEQLSVAGSALRPDVNQLTGRLGNIIFGKRYNWLKLDLDTTVDFEDTRGAFFGTLEAGGLLIGRVGLFIRSGTQLIGPRELDYTIEAGIRYLFRLEKGK
jgi:hypothetical protein